MVDCAHEQRVLVLGPPQPVDVQAGATELLFQAPSLGTAGVPEAALNNVGLLRLRLLDGAGATAVETALLTQVTRTAAGFTRRFTAPG